MLSSSSDLTMTLSDINMTDVSFYITYIWYSPTIDAHQSAIKTTLSASDNVMPIVMPVYKKPFLYIAVSKVAPVTGLLSTSIDIIYI